MVENLEQSFEDRFRNLKQKRPQITFLINPFTAESDCLKAPLVADEAASQLEMIKRSEDDRLVFWEKEPQSFGKLCPQTDPNIKQAALKLMSRLWITQTWHWNKWCPNIALFLRTHIWRSCFEWPQLSSSQTWKGLWKTKTARCPTE